MFGGVSVHAAIHEWMKNILLVWRFYFSAFLCFFLSKLFFYSSFGSKDLIVSSYTQKRVLNIMYADKCMRRLGMQFFKADFEWMEDFWWADASLIVWEPALAVAKQTWKWIYSVIRTKSETLKVLVREETYQDSQSYFHRQMFPKISKSSRSHKLKSRPAQRLHYVTLRGVSRCFISIKYLLFFLYSINRVLIQLLWKPEVSPRHLIAPIYRLISPTS